MNKFLDTIVAPATSISKQAISIIRISGEDCFNVVNKSLRKKIPFSKGTFLRNLYNEKKELIDQVLIHCFIGKNSFTGENSIEINCHGGILVTKKLINQIILNGARMAENGEFSKRAFLNQKISLIQAQGINDLIESKNDLSYKISVNNMSNKTSEIILGIKNDVIDIISEIQTAIDYPEYEETEDTSLKSVESQIISLHKKINRSINISKRISNFKSGIKTAIIGKPNVGKSSLLNALIDEDKAIVSDIKGTTRDVVEGEINLSNFSLQLFDTAGIHETDNEIEKIGIKKSIEVFEKADLILYVLNSPDEILIECDFNKTIFVFNKKDQMTSEDIIKINEKFKDKTFVLISALTKDIEILISTIEKKYELENIFNDDTFVLSNLNEISLLEVTASKIYKSIENIRLGTTIDLVNIDLRDAIDSLNELLGIQDIQEEIINNIFKKYCLGK